MSHVPIKIERLLELIDRYANKDPYPTEMDTHAALIDYARLRSLEQAVVGARASLERASQAVRYCASLEDATPSGATVAERDVVALRSLAALNRGKAE